MDLQTHASALAGVLVPVITELIKEKLVKVSDKAAHFLSLVVAGGCVALAHFGLHQSLALTGIVGDAGVAWTLSQLVYRSFGPFPLPHAK